MLTKTFIFSVALMGLASAWAQVEPAAALNTSQKILSQGVPAKAFALMTQFLYENKGRSFQQSIYTCSGQDQDNVKPCGEEKRSSETIYVSLGAPENVVIIDYSAPSTERRFFLINLMTGKVLKYFVAHGIGSGKSNYATKFSNIKDSRKTSLGFYLTGDTYRGSYGTTLRMYGLENSNDQSYNRDIVLHGAWYVSEDFIHSVDPKTGEKRGRLGVSWGCPALSLAIAKKVIPVLRGGSLILHYHADFQTQEKHRVLPLEVLPAE